MIAATAEGPYNRANARTSPSMQIKAKHPTIFDRGPTRQSLNVLVSGFAGHPLASIEDIAAIIDVLPAAHLAGLDEIIYDPKWETPSALELLDTNLSRKSKAVYLRQSRKILVFAFDDLAQLRHILYHEIGHHVFDRLLESRLRKRWVTLLNPDSRHVTRYAKRNALEDFAESYAIFVDDPKRLNEAYRKYVFLRDKVFAGIACNLEKGHLDITV